MNRHRARLLIRTASKLHGHDDEADRGLVLSWADELLAEEDVEDAGGDPVILKVTRQEIELPLPIIRRYKHEIYTAELLKRWRVRMNGTLYPSPTAAAVAITGSNVNGWRFWRYEIPETGEFRLIDRLRSLDRTAS